MKTTSERLRIARENAGFKSAADFARSINVGESTYRHHENGTGGRRIPASRLELYAERLGVSLSWLVTGKDSNDNNANSDVDQNRVLPIISLTAIEVRNLYPGIQIDNSKLNIEDGRERVYLPVDASNAAAIEMPDDSMSRVIPPGERIVVDFDQQGLVDQRLYLIRMNGEPMIRRYRTSDRRSWFEADSYHHHYDLIDAGIIEGVIGRVVYRYAEL